MSNIFDTNAKLNEAKEGLVSEFARTLTFSSLLKTIEPDDMVDSIKALAGEFKKSAEFSKVCNELKFEATIMDPPYDLGSTKMIEFDGIYRAHLIPESEDSLLRKEEHGSITERWHLYECGKQIGVLSPNRTDFNNEDEVLTNLTNLVAQTKLSNSLGLRSRFLGYTDLEM